MFLQSDLYNKDLKKVLSLIHDLTKDRAYLIPIIADYIISSGGKRLRPFLHLAIASILGEITENNIKLAASVELIHTATLLHDDVVDESDLRRGLPTANTKWGNKPSILVGDFLFSLAFQLMSQTGNAKVLECLSQGSSVIAEGEVLQLKSIANLEVNHDDYIRLISAKTAELFAVSSKSAGILHNLPEEELDNLYKIGLYFGIAFQIMDDLLDYFSETKAIGKNIGDDFMEAKVTLPVIIAYERATNEEKQFWQKCFIDNHKTNDDLAKAVILMSKNNVYQACYQVAEEYLNKAKECLNNLAKNLDKTLIYSILDYSITRKN